MNLLDTVFYKLLTATSVGNEQERQMRIQILILGFKVNCIISESSFCLHLDEYPGMVWKNNIAVWQTPARVYR